MYIINITSRKSGLKYKFEKYTNQITISKTNDMTL